MVLLEFEIIYSGLLFVEVSSYHRRIECDGSHKGAKSIASKTQQEKQRSPKGFVLTWWILSTCVSICIRTKLPGGGLHSEKVREMGRT